MPCGGIYPSKHIPEQYTCWYCRKPKCDHWLEEWDSVLHAGCVIPFLHTEEGEVVIGHKHQIQIGMFVLQNENGELMDPSATLQEIRGLIKQLQPLRDGDEPAAGLEDSVCDLIEAVENLDGWMSHGGFPPAEWKKDG